MPKANNHPDLGPVDFANLKRLAYFAAVIEAGTFTAAADRLGVTKAVVSQQVARLERDFRTQLLTRTTRRVTATDAGKAFYERCALILREAGDAFDELAGVSTEPSGTLRLTAPLDYGLTAVVPAVVEFSRRFPQCKVDVVLSDMSLDLLSGQVEMAIRVGWLTDMQFQARQIGAFRQILVGAPAWARRLQRRQGPTGGSYAPEWLLSASDFVVSGASSESAGCVHRCEGRSHRSDWLSRRLWGMIANS